MPYKDNLIAREDNVFLNDVLCQIDQSKSTDNSYQTNVLYLRYLSGPCKAKLCHGEKRNAKISVWSEIVHCVSTYLHDNRVVSANLWLKYACHFEIYLQLHKIENTWLLLFNRYLKNEVVLRFCFQNEKNQIKLQPHPW